MIAGGIAMGSLGCGDGSLAGMDFPDSVPPEEAYWSLALQDQAINLSVTAPTNTMQLVAIPRNAVGDPLAKLSGSPVFITLDPARVSVDSTGRLIAHAPGVGLAVIVMWQIQTITHQDTAYINVTDTAPASPLAIFSLQPAPGDSAKWSWNVSDFIFGPKQLTPTTIGLDGQTIPVERVVDGIPVRGLCVAYTSSNIGVATINPRTGELSPSDKRAPDVVVITASTFAYGVRKVDSIRYRIGRSTWQSVMINRGVAGGPAIPDPVAVTIGVGGVVSWGNTTGQTIALLFDDPTVVSATTLGLPDGNSGNIPVFLSDEYMYRQFNVAGVYQYRDAQGRLLGTITVTAD